MGCALWESYDGKYDGNIWWEIVGKYDGKYCDGKYDGTYYDGKSYNVPFGSPFIMGEMDLSEKGEFLMAPVIMNIWENEE